jgi:hypothetical protein
VYLYVNYHDPSINKKYVKGKANLELIIINPTKDEGTCKSKNIIQHVVVDLTRQ